MRFYKEQLGEYEMKVSSLQLKAEAASGTAKDVQQKFDKYLSTPPSRTLVSLYWLPVCVPIAVQIGLAYDCVKRGFGA